MEFWGRQQTKQNEEATGKALKLPRPLWFKLLPTRLLCVAILLYAVTITVGALNQDAWAMSTKRHIQSKKPPCNMPPPRKVIIGGHTFQFPQDGELFINSSTEIPCADITSAINILYYPPSFLNKGGAINGEGFVLGLSIIASPNSKPSNPYFERAIKKLEEKKISMKDLPQQGDFYVFDENPNSFWYFSKNSNLRFSPDTPLVLECQGGQFNTKKTCYTATVWKGNVTFGIHFSTTFFPIYQFKQLYLEVVKFLEGLEVAKNK